MKHTCHNNKQNLKRLNFEWLRAARLKFFPAEKKKRTHGKEPNEMGRPCNNPPSPLTERQTNSSQLFLLTLFDGFVFIHLSVFLESATMSFLNLFSTKEKVKFDIHIKDISFIKNEYFLSHSRYSIELPDYHSKVEAKHDVATSSDLNKVSFRHSMKFISTLTVNSRAGKSHFEPKNKKIIVRQTSPDLNPRGSDVLIADIGHAILPLHELANAVKDQDYFLEIHDSDVVGRIRITVRHLNMSKTHSSSDLHTRDTFLGRSVSAYSMEGEAEAPPHGLSVQISQNSNHSQTSSNNSSFHSTNADRSVNQEIVGKKLTPTNRHKKKPSGSNHDEVLKALSQEEENSEAFKTTNTTEKDSTEHKCASIELQPVDTENRKQLSSAAESKYFHKTFSRSLTNVFHS